MTCVDPETGDAKKRYDKDGNLVGLSLRPILPAELNQAAQAYLKAADLEYGRAGGKTQEPERASPDLAALLEKVWAEERGGGTRGPVTLELIPAITFFTNNNDFLNGKTLEQAPIYSVQGHLIYEFFPAFWAALDATYYAGGRTTINGEEGQQPGNVRLGLTAALSLSRHQSIKVYGSTGIYSRTDNNFWAVGMAWQYRWGGGL